MPYLSLTLLETIGVVDGGGGKGNFELEDSFGGGRYEYMSEIL